MWENVGENEALELVRADDGHAPDGARFEFVSDMLVRVEFRRVWLEEVQLDFRGPGLDKVSDFFGLVAQMPIDDQKELALGVLEHALEKVDELSGIHPAFDSHEAEFAAATDR